LQQKVITAIFDADSATRSKTLAIKVCHTGTTQLNATVEAPFRRHKRLKNILYHTLKAAGYSPQMETAHLIPGSLIRPGDVYVPVGDDGMAVAYDVTVVLPVVESSLSSSARSVGFAADAAERRKAVHYANNCASQVIQFIPLAQETLGGWSTQAGKILSLLADRIADRKGLQCATCRSALFRELGIATQRSIARDIIE
jgi:hypothetical protein